jgi:hypothetical protein
MLRILVAGGFNEENEELLKEQQEFAVALGREIIDQGHVLLNACLTSFDLVIAESANNRVKELGDDPIKRIISYVLPGQQFAHQFGNVLQSQLQNWELGSPKLRVPEPIQLADAIVLVGGFEGTYRAANWARIAKKPLLPITRFGGTAEQVFTEELDDFEPRYGSRVSRSDYENLAQLKSPPDVFAKTVVALAELARTSRAVFVVMSFAEDPALEDALNTFKEVCKLFGYVCERVDEGSNVPRILPEIIKRIAGCAFTIVDLSVQSPNVYYELGYAEGQGKPVIVTAKKGTTLPFDAKDIPVCLWENQAGLRAMLTKKVEEIAKTQGRSA